MSKVVLERWKILIEYRHSVKQAKEPLCVIRFFEAYTMQTH